MSHFFSTSLVNDVVPSDIWSAGFCGGLEIITSGCKDGAWWFVQMGMIVRRRREMEAMRVMMIFGVFGSIVIWRLVFHGSSIFMVVRRLGEYG